MFLLLSYILIIAMFGVKINPKVKFKWSNIVYCILYAIIIYAIILAEIKIWRFLK